MSTKDARRTILARRARFVAAAVASLGVAGLDAACSRTCLAAQGVDEERRPRRDTTGAGTAARDAGTDVAEPEPCLKVGPAYPCLEIAPPPDGGWPGPCLSVAIVPDAGSPADAPKPKVCLSPRRVDSGGEW